MAVCLVSGSTVYPIELWADETSAHMAEQPKSESKSSRPKPSASLALYQISYGIVLQILAFGKAASCTGLTRWLHSLHVNVVAQSGYSNVFIIVVCTACHAHDLCRCPDFMLSLHLYAFCDLDCYHQVLKQLQEFPFL